jgi:hypothetical protein
MKNNLRKEYLFIEERNKKSFLANKIELDTHWGKPIWGVAFQVDLGDKAEKQLERYQNELDRLEPGNFLFPARGYRHISICQVVHWLGNYSLGNLGTWQKIRPEFLPKFRKLDNVFQSFEVTFSKLIATSSGIIWCAYDENGEMQRLRDSLKEKLPIPAETAKVNNIIHTTLSRYKNKLNDPKKIIEFIESHKKPVKMKVNKVYLRNEVLYHSAKTKTLAKIRLK